LAAVAVFTIAGGHWCCLQIAAWSGMLVSYSQHSGIVEGVVQTFDGNHPCGLCNAVNDGVKHEAKSPINASDQLKKDFLVSSDRFTLWSSWTEHQFVRFEPFWFNWSGEPIAPPPRS
jgi:hypothetical protein